MKLLRDLTGDEKNWTGGAVTIGNFDGVHRGHARIVEAVLAQARQVAGPAVVFTFDPHPVRLLRPHEVPPPLTWTDRKAELLGELGVDVMIAYPTDRKLLALTAEEFFQQIICESLAARALVEGPNFRFGKGRQGDVNRLAALCGENELSLQVVQPLVEGDEYVSSSRVRQLVAEGEIGAAAKLLTRPYRIRGMVTHGAGRGASIGFPTANLDAVDTLIPAPGVYAARAILPEGTWRAAVNIGPNPTFGEHVLKIEAHLLDFHDSLYGKPLEIDFLKRLRGVQTFSGIEALQDQLARDIAAVRQEA